MDDKIAEEYLHIFFFSIGKLRKGKWWGLNTSAQAPQEVLEPLQYPSNPKEKLILTTHNYEVNCYFFREINNLGMQL